MGRVYTVTFEQVAVSVLQDLWSVQVPADIMLIVHGFEIFQTSDVQDAEEEILRIRVKRQTGSFTVGSGGAAGTNVRAQEGDAAALVTSRTNDTTQATGTFETVDIVGWNVRIPQPKIWVPETQMTIRASSDLVIDLPEGPVDSLDINATLTFEEIG